MRGTANGSLPSGVAGALNVHADGVQIGFSEVIQVPSVWQLDSVYFLAGETYSVTSNASGCRVINGTGVMPNHDVEGIDVRCGNRLVQYEVIGLVGTGLQVTLASQPAAPGSPPVQETLNGYRNGVDKFEAGLAEGDPYSVTVTTAPSNPTQECTVENGSGTVGAQDVNNVVVRCENGLQREWSFYRESTLESSDSAELGVVDVQFDMPEFAGLPRNDKKISAMLGLGHLDIDIYENLFDRPGTNMTVFSDETGKTYWIATEAATGQTERTTQLVTRWWIRKDRADAKFTLQITDVWFDAVVDSAGSSVQYVREARVLRSSAHVSMFAVKLLPNSTELGMPFFYLDDSVSLTAVPDAAGAIEDFHLSVLPDSQAFSSIFSQANFVAP